MAKTKPIFRNSVVRQSEDGEMRRSPKGIHEILTDIHEATGEWPRCTGGELFFADGNDIRWIKSPTDLFSWLHSKGDVQWIKGGSFVGRPELFSHLRAHVQQYDTVAYSPHEPSIDRVYYAGKPPKPGDGKYLDELLSMFCPATEQDAQLIKAFVLTMLWGGPAGARPLFVITSDYGRGVGKTVCALLLSELVGGHISIDANCKMDSFMKRLLSPVGRSKRVVLLDNIKSLQFSWAELEGLLTSSVVSGHRMFEGEGQCPNLLVWVATVNGASFCDDMAQRSVFIKLERPPGDGGWMDRVRGLITKHRQQILGDIIAALRTTPAQLSKYSRWSVWEAQVLARLPGPDALRDLILSRQHTVNCEGRDAEDTEGFFAEKLRICGYDPSANRVFIPSSIAVEWYREATNRPDVSFGAASKLLAQLSRETRSDNGEKKLPHVSANTHHGEKRGYIWRGDDAGPFDDLELGLEDRWKYYREGKDW